MKDLKILFTDTKGKSHEFKTKSGVTVLVGCYGFSLSQVGQDICLIGTGIYGCGNYPLTINPINESTIQILSLEDKGE